MDLALSQPAIPLVATDAVPSEKQARFEAFVAAHRERAVRTAFRLVGGDAAVAEDVAQEAFLRAHRGLDRFRDDAQLSTWFYRILVRQASNYRRKVGVRRRLQALLPLEQAAPAAATDPLLRDSIAAALERLSDKQRTVFVLVYLEQMSVVDAAEAMGCAVGTAKSHLHRALKSLRAELATQGLR